MVYRSWCLRTRGCDRAYDSSGFIKECALLCVDDPLVRLFSENIVLALMKKWRKKLGSAGRQLASIPQVISAVLLIVKTR